MTHPTPTGWIYEDTLPEEYPYDAMFPYSEVRDGVRMFPVHAPAPAAPMPNSNDGWALREACAGISDDYMTSEKHHPGYVLIPTAKFDAIRNAMALAPIPSREDAFKIGDCVQVSPSCEYYADWEGQKLFVVGMDYDIRAGEIQYTLADNFPPKGRGDCTDQWKKQDIIAALSNLTNGEG